MGWRSAILKASIWSVLRTKFIFTAYWIARAIRKWKNFTHFQKFPVKRPQRDKKNRPEKRIECWTIKTLKLVTKKYARVTILARNRCNQFGSVKRRRRVDGRIADLIPLQLEVLAYTEHSTTCFTCFARYKKKKNKAWKNAQMQSTFDHW